MQPLVATLEVVENMWNTKAVKKLTSPQVSGF